MSSRKPMQVTKLLALAFVALGSVVLLISSTLEIYFHFRTQQENLAARQQLIAHEAASRVVAYIQGRFQIMESAVRFGDLANGTGQEQKEVLDVLLGLDHAFRHAVMLDIKGKERIRTSRLSISKWAEFTGRFESEMSRQAQMGNRYVSSVHIDPLTSEPLVIMAIPVTNIFRDAKSVLAVEVNLKFMWDLVDRLKVGKTGRAYVVDREGNLIAFGDTGRVLRGENLAHLEPVSLFIKRQPAQMKSNDVERSTGITGGPVVGTFVALGTPDWAVVTEIPVDEAYGQVVRSALITVAIFLVMAVLAGLMGVIVARRFARPIINLTDTAVRITEGGLGLKAEKGGPLEVTRLADAFNTMTQRLQSLLAAEEQRSQDLVREVAQRKEAEERLDMALSGANEGIWDWNLQTGEVHFDSRYYTMAGYEPYEFPEAFEEWEKRVRPEDVEQAKSKVDQYLSGESQQYSVEFPFLRKEGDYMWIRGKGKIVARDEQNNPLRFIGTHADITESKEIQEELWHSRQLLNSALETVEEGFVVFDREFKCTYRNRAMETISGIPNEEMMGIVPWEKFESLRGGESFVKKALAGEATRKREVSHFRRGDSGVQWLLASYFPLRDAQGQITGVLSVLRDVTEHRQAEEELRRLRNYLSNIINSMPSILIAVSSEGNVTQWNNQTERYTGMSFEEVRDRPLTEVFPRLIDEMDHIGTAIREHRVVNIPKVTNKSDQDTHFEDITIFPLQSNGVEGAVIRLDDVTERVRMEEMMIQSEKMLTVGGLAAGMAHEINNPLAGMIQTSMVMKQRLSSNFHISANRKAAEAAGTTLEAIEQFINDRNIPRMLETIQESGQRIVSVVENMLSFARKSESQVSSHDLGSLMDKTLELAQTDYDLKKGYDFRRITVEKEYADPPVLVPCESTKIQQVLLNLLRNGAQAMQEAGVEHPSFIFRTRLDEELDMAVMEIEDNGPGMDEVTCKKIFDPFFTTKAEGEGTGLGLSVSHFIVTEDHQGEMFVESNPGSGAKFTIRLPLERECE